MTNDFRSYNVIYIVYDRKNENRWSLLITRYSLLVIQTPYNVCADAMFFQKLCQENMPAKYGRFATDRSTILDKICGKNTILTPLRSQISMLIVSKDMFLSNTDIRGRINIPKICYKVDVCVNQ